MASIELRTPKNKPAYYKITASITLNGQTIRKFSRFEFDPKTLKTAKQRAAAAGSRWTHTVIQIIFRWDTVKSPLSRLCASCI